MVVIELTFEAPAPSPPVSPRSVACRYYSAAPPPSRHCGRMTRIRQGEIEQRQQSGRGPQLSGDDLLAARPLHRAGIVAGDPFARTPDAAHRDQRVMVADAAIRIPVDRLQH